MFRKIIIKLENFAKKKKHYRLRLFVATFIAAYIVFFAIYRYIDLPKIIAYSLSIYVFNACVEVLANSFRMKEYQGELDKSFEDEELKKDG